MRDKQRFLNFVLKYKKHHKVTKKEMQRNHKEPEDKRNNHRNHKKLGSCRVAELPTE